MGVVTCLFFDLVISLTFQGSIEVLSRLPFMEKCLAFAQLLGMREQILSLMFGFMLDLTITYIIAQMKC